MLVQVKIPSVGESVTSGLIGVWHQQEGAYVRPGDILFEVETDKATSEVFAEHAGVLRRLAEEGAEVLSGQVVAEIEESSAPPIQAEETTEMSAANQTLAPSHETSMLSPATRHDAEEARLNSAVIEDSGRGRRALKKDIIAAIESESAAFQSPSISPPSVIPPMPLEKSSAIPRASGPVRVTRKRLSTLRKKLADRLVNIQHEAALLTTFNEADMSNAQALRKRFQERFVEKYGVKLGFMSLFVKAAVYALQSVPCVNGRIEGKEIVENHFYDIGIAIATHRGLLVPVLRDADRLSLADIEREILSFSQKAREGGIQLSDLEGGVFTITNGGVFGSLLSTPIVNPPQSAILGMHVIQDRPVAVEGRVEIRPMMYLALTYDHRSIDGREAVTFLIRIKEFIEQPALDLLGL